MTQARFATRWNLDVLEAAYQRWKADPASVDESWRFFFETLSLMVRMAAGCGRCLGICLCVARFAGFWAKRHPNPASLRESWLRP